MSRQQYLLVGIFVVLAVIAAYVYFPRPKPPAIVPYVDPAAASRPSDEEIEKTVAKLQSLHVAPDVQIVSSSGIGANKKVQTKVQYVVFPPKTDINLEAIDLLNELPDFSSVSFYDTPFSDDHISELLNLKRLSEVNLNYTRVTDAGVAKLAELPGLRDLNLNGTQITDASLAALAKSQTLQSLDLYETKITDAGLSQLSSMPNLAMVDAQGTGVTAEGAAALKKAKENCTILFDPY